MSNHHAMSNAFSLDRQGGGSSLSHEELEAWEPGKGILWLHLHLDAPQTPAILADQCGVDPLVCAALGDAANHPRLVQFNEQVMLFLRGVNLNLLYQELTSRQDHSMNLKIYVLTILNGIFLPLAFLTGLLGVNVGGVPLQGDPSGFLYVCTLLVVLGGGGYWLARRKGWI